MIVYKRGPTEEVTFMEDGEEIRARLIEDKLERAKHPDDFVPFDVEEYEANNDRALPIMKAFMVDGTEEGFANLRKRCKQEKVNGLQ